jgi:hypothetical protein
VIDEREFLLFYHDLMERDEIYVIFDSYAKTHRGSAMTLRELKRFLSVEQKIADVSLVNALARIFVATFWPNRYR